MAINISLVNYTEQGIKSIKDSPKRAQGFRDLAKKHGVSVRDIYWTAGQYDMVVITEGTEESLATVLLSVAKLGNVRSQTLRAMDQETFQRVLGKVE
ncbi:MAG TPA: GYD domain-containing protein [Burkholderiales bacterium]